MEVIALLYDTSDSDVEEISPEEFRAVVLGAPCPNAASTDGNGAPAPSGSDKPAQGEPQAADVLDDDEDLVIVDTFGQVCYWYQHQLTLCTYPSSQDAPRPLTKSHCGSR